VQGGGDNYNGHDLGVQTEHRGRSGLEISTGKVLAFMKRCAPGQNKLVESKRKIRVTLGWCREVAEVGEQTQRVRLRGI